ncbi:MAG: hypothetical protein ACYDEY_15695 [Acidimicrobiales bacterium]
MSDRGLPRRRGGSEVLSGTRHAISGASRIAVLCMVGVLVVGCASTAATGSAHAKNLSSRARNHAGKRRVTTARKHPPRSLLPLAWRAAPVPSGAANGFLVGVSCMSARFCVAVGSSPFTLAPERFIYGWVPPLLLPGGYPNHGPPRYPGHAVVETFNGNAWHDAPLLGPVANSGLNAVSCVSTRFCVAVGSGPAGALIVGFNGKSWRTATFNRGAVRAQHGAVLNAVSCVSARFCVAVGYRAVETEMNWNLEAVTETFNGHSWRFATGPYKVSGLRAVSARYPWVTSLHLADLDGVSCVSTRFCVAVSAAAFFVVDVYNGKAWKARVRLPGGNLFSLGTPNFGANGLGGVSCASTRFCAAVESWTTPQEPGIQIVATLLNSQRVSPIVETFDGSRWVSAASTPSNSIIMNAVSCVSKTFCVGVSAPGMYKFGIVNPFNGSASGPTADILRAQTFNGSTWQGSIVNPSPSTNSLDLYAISCVRERMSVSCMAVGSSNGQGPAKHQVAVEIASPVGNPS